MKTKATVESTEHLEFLENESIFIMREVAATSKNPVLLFSGGKDSVVMLRIAQKAFAPMPLPFPLLHIDTGHNFSEVLAFRDEKVTEINANLIIRKVEDSIKRGSSRESLIAACIWNALKAKDNTRSTKEIAKLFKISIKKMTLGCKEFNEKMYNKNKNFVNNIKPTKSADYITRYCMLLKLDNIYIKKVEHIVNIANLIGILIQNTPQSIAVGCIFIVSEQYNLGFTKKMLHGSCDISEVTISKTYKELIKYSKYIFIEE